MTEPSDASRPEPTAALLIVGDEILSGRTRDANLQHLAERLQTVGVPVVEARVIPDRAETVIAAVRELSSRVDYLFTSGGIGPTHDDITADCVAAAFERAIDVHPEARARLERHYAESEHALNEARLRMARIPDGAELIDNPVSAAPGFRLENVYVMAGVPRIMAAMLDQVIPTLKGGGPLLAETVRCNLPEGEAAEGLRRIAEENPTVGVGSYPKYGSGGFQLSIVVRGRDAKAVEAAAQDVETLVRELGGQPERLAPGEPA
ncbi:MAG: competence/damage-inducible protein A [Marivibrio sp.]|uniref:competence/damage-inducible protein A n=1 Tax=Marivibrio sp. TaxID=2039719 RepID=UPI0032EF635C